MLAQLTSPGKPIYRTDLPVLWGSISFNPAITDVVWYVSSAIGVHLMQVLLAIRSLVGGQDEPSQPA
ncbi:MAG: hypothetical protein MUO67_09890 [Anaerolineales bacterium]|nr:hypothetical protein [Anaerolineales bacterium]